MNKPFWKIRRYAASEARIRRLQYQLDRGHRKLAYLVATDPVMKAGLRVTVESGKALPDSRHP